MSEVITNDGWTSCAVQLPSNGEVVETRLGYAESERNVQPLIRRNRLWFFPDMSMYVYYTPEYWRPLKSARPA